MELTPEELREMAKEEFQKCATILDDIIDYYSSGVHESTKAVNESSTTIREEGEAILIIANCTKGMLEYSKKSIDFGDDQFIKVVVNTIWMGVNIGQLKLLDQKSEKFSGFQKTISTILGRRAVKQGRWERVEAIKQSLISQAEAKWTAGDLLLHNEMADALLENNPKAAQSISKPVLLAALKPIAAKHGKVRGIKGVRKEKLPPK